jgi:hypothetical protein
MKKSRLACSLPVILGMSILCGALLATLPAAAYDSAQVRHGKYLSQRLYFKDPASGKWLRGEMEQAFPECVVCPEALQKLKQTGFWTGRLRPDGSCGSDGEHREWAVGNRLNN